MKNKKYIDLIKLTNWLLLICIGITIILLLLDFFDIGLLKFSNLTKTYDWLAYAGGLITFLGTIILARVSLMQNKKLKEINEEMYLDSLRAKGISKIQYTTYHKLYLVEDLEGFSLESEDDLTEQFANKKAYELREGTPKTKGDGGHNNSRFLLYFKELNNQPLQDFWIEDLTIKYGKDKKVEVLEETEFLL